MTLLPTLARRLLVSVPILIIVSMLLFTALRVLPVDPAAMSMPPNATREEIEGARSAMGLDRALPVQYAIWLGDLLHGDLGRSIHLRRPVSGLLAETLPATVELTVLAMGIAGWRALNREAVEMGACMPLLQSVQTLVRKKSLGYRQYGNGWVLPQTMDWV